MITYPYIGNEGMYYSYAQQFLRDCIIFEREPLERYAVPYAEALTLESEPFWETVKEILASKKENEGD